MTTPFERAIQDIYRAHPHHFFPYVGSRYLDPAPGALRVLALGINAYVADAEWPPQGPEPGRFGGWFDKAMYRYQRGVLRDVAALAEALVGGPSLFNGRHFHGRASVYATNAVKVYLPASKGKAAVQLTPADFERHRDQWHRELQVMAQHSVLPHLLVVFGQPSWPTAWQAFWPSTSGTRSGLKVRSFHNAQGPSQHHANRITVELDDDRQHNLLLVRLRHPAGRSPTGAPSWLLRQAEFWDLLGVPASPPLPR